MANEFMKQDIYDNLPEFIKKLTDPFKDRERDMVLLSTIGVLSACFPKVYGIYDGQRYSTNLYLLIIAPPASGKGIMGKSQKLIEKIHINIKETSLFEIDDCKKTQKENKEKNTKCPPLDIKLVPGNVSSSKLYRHLENSLYGLLVFETEADTISTMLKQDWGNFSDVLRKAFHHETLSISRDNDDKFFEIINPKLSLVISGTPSQVEPLIKSQENGLFSRFMYYYFDEPSYWKDVSPQGQIQNTSLLFSESGDKIAEIYANLLKNESDIKVELTKEQWNELNENMTFLVNSFIKIKKLNILSSIKRYGVILFRICMILTVIRNKDNLSDEEIFYCDDKDFQCAFDIIKLTIDHSIKVSNLLDIQNLDPKKNLKLREALLFSELPKNFTKKEAIEISKTLDIPSRSLDYILHKLKSLRLIVSYSNGVYQRGG